MKGLSEKGLKSLEKVVQAQFDSFSLKFIGLIPTPSRDKNVVFKTTRNNLVSLFLQALQNRDPNATEERTLKTLLRVANGYLNGLKERTVAKITNDVDSYVRNQNQKNQPVSLKTINDMVEKEMDKAGKHLKIIANAESQKAINTGAALQISKMAQDKGEKDPTVFFVVTQDDKTGFYEYVLHLLPDRKTPRVWKLSEVNSGYYANGDQYPSLSGLHPNCRCKMTYLANGFGFDESGRVKYIDKNHDEFEKQRKEHGLPFVPGKPKKRGGDWVL